MKIKLLALAAVSASAISASAFSLDFTGLDLDGSVTLSGSDELIIGVADFGNVGFGVAEKGLSAVVDDNFGVPAIEFDDSRTITVTFFAGTPVENVMVSFVGVDQGESPVYTPVDSVSGLVSLPAGAVGIQAVTFDRIGGPKVPEPSTAVLGLIGALALIRRRR